MGSPVTLRAGSGRLPVGEPWTNFAGIPATSGSWRCWRRPPRAGRACRRGRQAAVALHLLPPGTVARSASRADSANGLWVVPCGDRARVLGVRKRNCATAHPCPPEDRDRWYPLSGSRHRPLAERLDAVVRASRLRRPGPYQLQAAIVACNAEAATWEATDWPQILLLYDALYARLPTPVVGLRRAIAVRQVVGSNVALAELDALAGALAGDHLFHSTRAQLLRDLGRATAARVADERPLGLTENLAERALLEQTLV